MLAVQRLLLSFFLIFSSSIAMANVQDLDTGNVWHEYRTFDGITVEYKFANYIKEGARDQILLLFRFSNVTSDDLKMTWTTKEFRVGECANCERIDNQEYRRLVVVKAGEMIEADQTSKDDQNVFIFSHFVKMVPGMTEHYLTDIEFVAVDVEPITENK